MSESISGFFGGSGGGTYAKFPNVGDKVSGTIIAVHPPEPQTDFETRQPIPGKYQVRIDLQTQERDPSVEDDDGVRTVYVKGWMTGAIGDALRKAKAGEPAVGAKLTVTHTGHAAPMRAGIQGAKQFSAVYEPTGSFFDPPAKRTLLDNGATSKDAPIPDSPPAGIDPAAWKEMPASAKQAIANVATAMDPAPF